MTVCGQPPAERVDQGGLAGSRNAGDADAPRLAGARQQQRQQLLRLPAMVVAGGFDQGDRSTDGPPLAVGDVSGLTGKTVDITGTVQVYQGKPEMIITSRGQIRAR